MVVAWKMKVEITPNVYMICIGEAEEADWCPCQCEGPPYIVLCWYPGATGRWPLMETHGQTLSMFGSQRCRSLVLYKVSAWHMVQVGLLLPMDAWCHPHGSHTGTVSILWGLHMDDAGPSIMITTNKLIQESILPKQHKYRTLRKIGYILCYFILCDMMLHYEAWLF